MGYECPTQLTQVEVNEFLDSVKKGYIVWYGFPFNSQQSKFCSFGGVHSNAWLA